MRKIVVTNPSGRFELRKDANEWRLTAPIADLANQGAVEGLLSTLAGLQAERSLPVAEAPLPSWGLDAPPLAVVAELEGGQSCTLKLGKPAALGSARAATTDGTSVSFVSGVIATDLEKGLKDWRSNQLLDRLFSTEVAAITVTFSGARVAVAHSGSLWTMTEPIADLADRERAEALIADLSAATVKEFIDAPGPLAGYGLDPRAFDVTIRRTGEKGEPIVLSFGKERDGQGGKELACRRGDQVLFIDAKAIERARATATEWRAKKLVQFDSWAADSLAIEAGAAKVTLARKDGTFRNGSVAVDQEPVQSRLSVLAELEVKAFDQATPKGTPLGTIKIKAEHGAVVDATFFAGATPDQALAVVPGRSGALAVDATRVRELLADPTALGKAKPATTPVPSVPPAAGTASPK
ncbi:MAG: DUF4340 domain-containing protein [Acidobacteria bacterium]|nr:DUF4340 domain-containing protein [Acidobacteriota bacterium]